MIRFFLEKIINLKGLYLGIFLLSFITSQYLFTFMHPQVLFPFATWNLFSQIPVDREISTLYFKNKNTGKLCYFYLCPGVRESQLTPHHPFNLVLWMQDRVNIHKYLINKIDLNELNYEVVIQVENTTMVKKWQEIAPQLIKKP